MVVETTRDAVKTQIKLKFMKKYIVIALMAIGSTSTTTFAQQDVPARQTLPSKQDDKNQKRDDKHQRKEDRKKSEVNSLELKRDKKQMKQDKKERKMHNKERKANKEQRHIDKHTDVK